MHRGLVFQISSTGRDVLSGLTIYLLPRQIDGRFQHMSTVKLTVLDGIQVDVVELP